MVRELALGAVSVALVAGALAGCGGGSHGASGGVPPLAAMHRKSGSSPIQHVVVMVQENRSFNNLFATFPGATGTTTGYELVKKGKHAKKTAIPLAQVPLLDKKSLTHLYAAYLTAWHNGAMDGFNRIRSVANGRFEGSKPYQYVNPQDVQPYWTMGTDYALADEMFQTQGSGSFTAHQDLIRGGTELSAAQSLIDDPTSAAAWGCDSRPGTKTSLITTKLKVLRDKGPFPCSNAFPNSGDAYKTLADSLDAAGVTWKYYVPEFKSGTTSALWNAYDVIYSVRYGSEWGSKVVWPETTIFDDVSNGTLPAMSWVIPNSANSDHPGYSSDTGPSWVASVVNAIGQSKYWNSTAIVIVWDDWGGLYDPVKPPFADQQGGAGFRVGMLVVSPYTPQGASCAGRGAVHTVYGFGSIVKFIEETWSLPTLGTTDQSSTSIGNLFDTTRSPCAFHTISSKYARPYFLHQKPSTLPVDTE